jgi:hypothetical protein
MKNSIAIILAGALVLGTATQGRDLDFYAYYTTLDYEQGQDVARLGQIPVNAVKAFAGGQADPADLVPRPPRNNAIRWGKYADLIVNVTKGRKLVFSRATGYLPYLQTVKGKYPLKSLVQALPDPLCLSSHVSVVQSDASQIVVHWRHVPDPGRVVTTETIHETFMISPAGKVRREVRVGTGRLDDFNDPTNAIVQQLTLHDDGVTELPLTPARLSDSPGKPISGTPVRTSPNKIQAAWLKFDGGLKPSGRDETSELIRATACSVSGNKTLWKKGVSGTALAFDGYFSKVTLPRDKAPTITDNLTLETWVALGAYPWNDAGIVHCASGEPIDPEDYKHGYRDPYTYRPWKMKGYLLGVDPYGRAIFKINGEQIGGGEIPDDKTVNKGDVLPTYRWTHLAATYGGGKMRLYVDGKMIASKPASGPIALPERDVLIGLNGDAQRISDPVSHSDRAAKNNLPLICGIEGLIDEVMIYDRVLSAAEIRNSFDAFHPTPDELTSVDLDRRVLPGGSTGQVAEKFGATCETLKFHELWDNLWRSGAHRDITVRFDEVPGSVVFWQGTNFGSGWVTENNKWMSDQSWEIGGPHGCAEHMADKRGRFNHIRLIENTDARVVVHWRYASIDVGYVFPHTGVWADEYYTIYPDGTGVRCVDGHPGGWQDTQFLSQPGTTCLDNINLTAMSVANLKGESKDLTWQLPNIVPPNPIKDACIKRINFKSEWKVFAVYQTGASLNTWGTGEQSKHTPDPFAGPWNHWPIGLNPSDGRYAVSNDRVTHAALGGARKTGELILYGFTQKPVEKLTALAKSWNHAPTVAAAIGCKSNGYDRSQRAYMLTATGKPLSFTLHGSEGSPVVNPCFVISNWNTGSACNVKVNGHEVKPGKNFRQGIVHDAKGKPVLIIYLKLEAATAVHVEAEVRPGS